MGMVLSTRSEFEVSSICGASDANHDFTPVLQTRTSHFNRNMHSTTEKYVLIHAIVALRVHHEHRRVLDDRHLHVRAQPPHLPLALSPYLNFS